MCISTATSTSKSFLFQFFTTNDHRSNSKFNTHSPDFLKQETLVFVTVTETAKKKTLLVNNANNIPIIGTFLTYI